MYRLRVSSVEYYLAVMPYIEDIWRPETGDRPPPRTAHSTEVERLRGLWRAKRDLLLDEVEGGLAHTADAIPEVLQELGRDAARAQRDGWLYWNFLEQLKSGGLVLPVEGYLTHGPDDEKTSPEDIQQETIRLNVLAGRIATRMMHLEMASMAFESGPEAPPPKTASRPFREFMKWLLRKLGDVTYFLCRIAEVFSRLVHQLFGGDRLVGELHLALSVGIPPSISVNFDPYWVVDGTAWEAVRGFIRELANEYKTAF